MSHDQVCEVFQKSVGILLDEKGRIKERLLTAYASQLSSINPKDDLPEPLLEEFMGIRYSLSDEGMPYGYGEHAAEKMKELSEDEASEIARRIFALFLKLVEEKQQRDVAVDQST